MLCVPAFASVIFLFEVQLQRTGCNGQHKIGLNIQAGATRVRVPRLASD